MILMAVKSNQLSSASNDKVVNILDNFTINA